MFLLPPHERTTSECPATCDLADATSGPRHRMRRPVQLLVRASWAQIEFRPRMSMWETIQHRIGDEWREVQDLDWPLKLIVVIGAATLFLMAFAAAYWLVATALL